MYYKFILYVYTVLSPFFPPSSPGPPIARTLVNGK